MRQVALDSEVFKAPSLRDTDTKIPRMVVPLVAVHTRGEGVGSRIESTTRITPEILQEIISAGIWDI